MSIEDKNKPLDQSLSNNPEISRDHNLSESTEHCENNDNSGMGEFNEKVVAVIKEEEGRKNKENAKINREIFLGFWTIINKPFVLLVLTVLCTYFLRDKISEIFSAADKSEAASDNAQYLKTELTVRLEEFLDLIDDAKTYEQLQHRFDLIFTPNGGGEYYFHLYPRFKDVSIKVLTLHLDVMDQNGNNDIINSVRKLEHCNIVLEEGVGRGDDFAMTKKDIRRALNSVLMLVNAVSTKHIKVWLIDDVIKDTTFTFTE